MAESRGRSTGSLEALMKLVVSKGMLTPGSVARLVAVAWFFGVGSLALVVLAFAALVGPLVAGLENKLHLPSAGQILPLLMIPVILALQSVVVGAVGALGVSVYSRYRTIEIEFVTEEAHSSSL